MVKKEIIILSVSTVALFLSLILTVVIIVIYFKHHKLKRKYIKLVENFKNLDSNLIPRSLHRLSIVSRVNIEYRAKYKTFENQYNLFLNKIDKLKNYSWTYDDFRKDKKNAEMQNILKIFSPEINKLMSIKRKLEYQLLGILKSDKNLDQEMSFLKLNYKKVRKSYEAIKPECQIVSRQMSEYINIISSSFKEFEIDYKNVNWEKCLNQIDVVRNLIINFAKWVNIIPQCDYFFNRHIPNLINDLNAYHDLALSIVGRKSLGFDYLAELIRIRNFFQQAYSQWVNFEQKHQIPKLLTDCKNNIIKSFFRIRIEIEAFGFIRKNSKKLIIYFSESLNKLEICQKKFIRVFTSSASFKKLLKKNGRSNLFNYKRYIAELKDSLSKLQSNLQNDNYAYFLLIQDISKIKNILHKIKIYENQILKMINSYKNDFSCLKNSVENMLLVLKNLLNLASKNQSKKNILTKIESLQTRLEKFNQEIAVEKIEDLAIWKNKMAKFIFEFKNTKKNIEQNFFVKKSNDFLVKMKNKMYAESSNLSKNAELNIKELAMHLIKIGSENYGKQNID